jgi:ligand-binding sensor domain-containing protein/serine phosphatase RsbU (regulator of sigma subunit)
MPVLVYRYCILLLLLCCSTAFVNAQSQKFRWFGTDDGITQPFIQSIDQDSKGYLWIGTSSGLYRYNGFKFEPFNNDNTTEIAVNSSFKDSKDRLWFGYKDGTISIYENGELKPVKTNLKDLSRITSFAEDKSGNVWIATQSSGVIKLGKNNQVALYQEAFEDLLIYAINFTDDDLLLAGTHQGVYQYEFVSGGVPSSVQRLSKIPDSKIQCIKKARISANHFWIGTQEEGLFLVELDYQNEEYLQVQHIGKDQGLDAISVQSAIIDDEANLWICTFGSGIYRGSKSPNAETYDQFAHYDEGNGLETNDIKTIFIDREGGIWLGAFGNGVGCILDSYFEFFDHADKPYGQKVNSILIDGDFKWTGLENGLLKSNYYNVNDYTFYTLENGFVDDKITALYKTDDGLLWVGTKKNGLFSHDTASGEFKKHFLTEDLLGNTINSITSDGRNIWVATMYGVFTLNPLTDNIFQFSTENGLQHNNIKHIYTAANRTDIWIANEGSSLSMIGGKEVENHEFNNGEFLSVMSIIEDGEKNIWIATLGRGVFKLGSTSFTNFTADDGLKSDFCYSLITDKNGNVWVGHREGLSKVTPSTGHIKVFDKSSGINTDFNANAVFAEPSGKIWFGTDNGTIKYDPSKDHVNNVPPITDLISTTIYEEGNSKVYKKGKDFTDRIVLPSGTYKIKFDFIGLSFNNSEKVTYSYKLQGFDPDWTENTTNNFAQYNRIEEGNYIFRVKACNSDGICNEKATQVSIVIEAPFWKKWWFILSVSLAVIAAVYIYVRIRIQRQRALEQYLKKALDARTREVVEQKDELERKNKDITDSINYAKRIQKAMMPEQSTMQKVFPGSYIFFRPRDIVSGDFYWFHLIRSKFLIACADATGHGVPGAFMSMIGSTVLQDTVSRKDINSPEEMLHTLDNGIRSLLSQQGGVEDSKDGMDISICEIDLRTRLMRVATAMRPVYIVSGGELTLIKGDRNPVGGSFYNQDKVFTLNEIQLKEGDVVYLFSDGFPDQFGGTEGRKLKISGMKEIIMELNDLPFEQHKDHLQKRFDEWQGDYKQVDDVLLISIRV